MNHSNTFRNVDVFSWKPVQKSKKKNLQIPQLGNNLSVALIVSMPPLLCLETLGGGKNQTTISIHQVGHFGLNQKST